MRRLLPIVLLLASSTALAFPRVLNHQGRLNDTAGVPLDGSHDLTFSLFDTPSGGTAVWTETQTVSFDDGYFSVDLGSSAALQDDWFEDSASLFLELAVDSGPPLPTRLELRPAPYAIVAGRVEGGTVDASEISIGGTTVIDSDGLIDWSHISGAPSDQDTLASLSCSDGQIASLASGSWTCVDRAHTHAPTDIVGVLDVGQLPIGTGSTNVAAGDHSHTANDVGALPAGTTPADIGALPAGTTPADIGALPDTTTAADIGAMPAVQGGAAFGAVGDSDCGGAAPAGTVRWSGSGLEVCDGTDWLSIRTSGSQDGSDITDPGVTCAQILADHPTSGSGLFWIDPTGSGTPWTTYCDMTVDGGGWTLVAYAGDRTGGFPRMDINAGSFNPSNRVGKASRGAVDIARLSQEMTLSYHASTGHSGALEDTSDAVSFVIPNPSAVTLSTSANQGSCVAVSAKRLKPDGSTHECVGSTSNGTAGVSATDCNPSGGEATAGVWTQSLGGTYSGNFAYGLYGTEWTCNSWPDISHHWWVDTQYYNWEPSATQYWSGSVNGATAIWFR